MPGDNFPPVTGFTAPADFTGFDVNTTITDTTGNGGYLTQYPSNAGSTPPLASDLNWNAGAIVSNANQLSSGGVPDIAIDNFNFTGNADLVIDLYGYFGKAPGHIYWAKDDGTITRANLDGTNPQTIVTGQSGPVGVAVDSAHIYWANFGDGTIDKANLDGSNPQTIVTGQNGPEGVAVDSAHIYWANGGDGTIIKANLDGTSPQTIVTGQDGGFAPDRSGWRSTAPTSTGPTTPTTRSTRPTSTAAAHRPSSPARIFRLGWRSTRPHLLGQQPRQHD